MTTPTITNVRAAFERYVELTKEFVPEGFVLGLAEGSKTYGNAYRLFMTGERAEDGSYPNGSGHWGPPIGPDFLGMTKTEAFNTLVTINRTIMDLKGST